MIESHVSLGVPAQPAFARSVRMMAANLAVLCSMSVEEVEDARMAAEEAFVYACATGLDECSISFDVSDDQLSMSFELGSGADESDATVAEQIGLALVLLSAVSDEYVLDREGRSLRVIKLAGGFHGA